MDVESVDQLRLWMGLVANGLIILGMPVLIAWAATNIRAKADEVKYKIGETRWASIDNTVRAAVRLAEQTGVLENLVGEEKKKIAIAYVQKRLEEQGIQGIDVEKIANLIENEVRHQFQNPTSVEDTLEARQALINQAVDSAILAAEQSGLMGTIENVGHVKKAYAIRYLQERLAEYGITIPENVVNTLIETRLIQMLTALREQPEPISEPEENV